MNKTNQKTLLSQNLCYNEERPMPSQPAGRVAYCEELSAGEQAELQVCGPALPGEAA